LELLALRGFRVKLTIGYISKSKTETAKKRYKTKFYSACTQSRALSFFFGDYHDGLFLHPPTAFPFFGASNKGFVDLDLDG
jgi:hypothetical protein